MVVVRDVGNDARRSETDIDADIVKEGYESIAILLALNLGTVVWSVRRRGYRSFESCADGNLGLTNRTW